MKKKIVFFLSVGLLMMLAACSTPEAEEVLDYHNDFVDYINPKLEELDQLFDKANLTETDEEAFDVVKNEITPVSKDIKDYFDEQDPKEDLTKEYHKLRSGWANDYYESIETQNDAYEALLEESEDEANELFEKAEAQMEESDNYLEEATEKWTDIMDKYKFEEEE